MRYLVLILVLSVLLACGKEEKSVFSVWTGEQSGSILDLSNTKMGTSELFFDYASGGRCIATVGVAGSEQQGTAIITNPLATGGADQATCDQLAGSYTFEIKDDKMTLCKSGACATYK